MRLMGELGVRRRRVGVVVAGIAEKVGRLRLTGSSPLTTLVELESLDLRINRKLDMWNALRSSVGDRVDGIDFDELIRRAERQAEALERRRLAVATDALPSVTDRPRRAAARGSSALLPKSFARPGPKSVSPATNCSGVEVVVSLKWMVAMTAPSEE